MNWNLIKLQIIELIDKHKRITTVADELGLKQPTVSFHMKNMEQELGVGLFYSKAGKVHLTDAGQSLNHYAKKINALAQEAERVVKEFDERGSGHLKIGASYVPGTYVLPSILSAFSKRYPHISISLTVRTSPIIQEMLLNHEIDIGVMSAEPFQWAPLIGETLCEDELVFFFSPDHRLARYETLYPEFLKDVPFILHGQESTTRTMTLKWAKNLGIELRPVMEMDSLEAIKQAVLTGDSVSVISKIAIAKEIEHKELVYHVIPHNPFKRYIYFTYNEDRIRSSFFGNFFDYLRDSVRTY
ncbi:LysR family transcriptional regulator [Paenibacillus marchantiophytorum]|uniref:LysR family transcriptional regulator n=1 Tax=Paenibacillus marchantiophytorum TaxID=1619310 RepID=A0ABQ1ELJ2_9BACL|nr:LysR family transcriptional regulator [Paenibacillus marchantiophytorum]GFZ77268.1 LysR family transcriptional regulator [Paenibacillus marchantiophytorum]